MIKRRVAWSLETKELHHNSNGTVFGACICKIFDQNMQNWYPNKSPDDALLKMVRYVLDPVTSEAGAIGLYKTWRRRVFPRRHVFVE
jgi:hypothetical protein